MTSSTFSKIGDIYQCKLTLEDGTEYDIPMREDGYIHATKMAKVVNKQVTNWKKSQETIKVVTRLKSALKIEEHELIEVRLGNSSKYAQGTWLHPDLGINFAQWCSPSFSLQVSKWIRELIITGKVEIGNEKSEQVIIEEYEEKLKEAKINEEKLKNELKGKDQLLKSQIEEAKRSDKIIVRQQQDHQSFLRRKNLYKLKKGPSVYLIDMNGLEPEYIKSGKFSPKVGYSADVTNRCSGFRTSSPFLKMYFHLYSPEAANIELAMKLFYKKQLIPNNREFISGVDKETLINKIIFYAEEFSPGEYTVTSQEELDKYNDHITPITSTTFIDLIPSEGDSLTKRCGGFTHLTEESRKQPLTNYFKNKANGDGLARICKECQLTSVYGDKRKKRKVVTILEFDYNTHKWCNLCESVKDKSFFYKDALKADGLNSNCKMCKNNQKMIQRNKNNKNNKNQKIV